MKETKRGKSFTISGTAWGDEGKAKMVDFVIFWLISIVKCALAMVIRPNGGANAGHTVVVDKIKFAFHLIASGIFHPRVKCVSGSGMAIVPPLFNKEIADLEKLGVDIVDRLIISEKAHLTFPWHIYVEEAMEKASGKRKIGSTKKGIGPTYATKAFRSHALRAGDLYDEEYFTAKFMMVREFWSKFLLGLGVSKDDIDALVEEVAA